MATVKLDTLGLRCPQPVLKIAAKLTEMSKGDVLEVAGDCPTFEDDLRNWCQRTGKALLAVRVERGAKVATIQV